MSSLHALLAADNGGGSSVFSLLFLPIMLVGAYFLLIRPQRRRQRDAVAMQSQLGEGDEVITTSGMYGFITGFDGDIVWLEIDDNIQVRVARAAISRKVDTSGHADAPSTSGTNASSTSIDDITEDDTSDK